MSLDVDVRVRRGTFVADVAFGVDAGETVAILGPNGAGKSSIVDCLAGLLEPERSRIMLDGRLLDDVPPGARPIGVVFQGLLLFPHLSALENAAFPLRARGVPRRKAGERAAALLSSFGIPHRANARPKDLSGGEAQRVALARALVHEPRLLVLDEPLTGLDVRSRVEMRSLLRRILGGFDGVRVLITHDPVEATTLADRLVLMEEGRVTQRGTPEDIRAAPRTPYAAELVGVNLFTGRLEPIEGGAGRFVEGGDAGGIVVAWPAGVDPPLHEAIAVLRPADVALHVNRPQGSPRNALHGAIDSISVEGERARVRVASSPPIVAEITLGSVSRLGLEVGRPVWASFKAVEVRVLPGSGGAESDRQSDPPG